MYPVGHEWVTNPYASPLRFAYNEDEGQRSMRALASDALRMAATAGLIQASRSRHRVRVGGEVVGIPLPERAVVKHDGGMVRTTRREPVRHEQGPLGSLGHAPGSRHQICATSSGPTDRMGRRRSARREEHPYVATVTGGQAMLAGPTDHTGQGEYLLRLLFERSVDDDGPVADGL